MQKPKKRRLNFLESTILNALRMMIKSSFDPKIEWVIPDGNVPYEKNEAPDGTEHTLLAQEVKKMFHYIKGADNQTPQWKKENMFIQMLEGLSAGEAEVVCHAKDKKNAPSVQRSFCGSSEGSVWME